MMLRSLGVTMLAIGLAAPASAQQTTASQQDLHRQVEAYTSKWVDAFNKGDAKGVAALVDQNACTINPQGMVCGLPKIEERIESVMKTGPHYTMKVDEVRPIGKEAAAAAGSYTITYPSNPATPQAEGNYLRVLERQGNEWKSIASSFTPKAPPAPAVATGTTGAPASTGSSTPPAPATGTK